MISSEYIYAIIYVSRVYCLSHNLCPIIKGRLESTDDEDTDPVNTSDSGIYTALFNLMRRFLWAIQYRVTQALYSIKMVHLTKKKKIVDFLCVQLTNRNQRKPVLVKIRIIELLYC